MSDIRLAVTENLTDDVKSGMFHVYTRSAEEIVANMFRWSDLQGFDQANKDQIERAVKAVTNWRVKNPQSQHSLNRDRQKLNISL